MGNLLKLVLCKRYIPGDWLGECTDCGGGISGSFILDIFLSSSSSSVALNCHNLLYCF